MYIPYTCIHTNAIGKKKKYIIYEKGKIFQQSSSISKFYLFIGIEEKIKYKTIY